jgi:hypothetical protein
MQRKISTLRELEEQCRKQSQLSATPETRVVLDKMAFERYGRLAGKRSA